MNILIFSPFPSHPDTEGSRKRILKLTKYLQNIGHTIHFVYFAQEGYDVNYLEAMQAEWDTFTLIEKTFHCEASIEGYGLDDWYQDDIHLKINELIEMFNIDVVWVNYLMQSKLLNYVPKNILKIIDTHDIFAERHLRINKNVDYKYTWYSISKEDEIKGLNRADLVIAIQDEEAKYFASIVDRPVKTIKHLAERNFLNKSYGKLEKIGFIGAWNDTNVTPINQFITQYINSDISKHIKLVIAGTVCSAIEKKHPNIELQGVVENLEDFYGDVDLVLNPLTYGTGLNIKSVETLSFGIPIISTKVGFRGINSDSKYHQLDTHEEMIKCIAQLYDIPEKLSKLAKLSCKIFDAYEAELKHNLVSLLDTKIKKSKKRSLKKKEQKKIIQQLYKQLQSSRYKKFIYENYKNSEIQELKHDLQWHKEQMDKYWEEKEKLKGDLAWHKEQMDKYWEEKEKLKGDLAWHKEQMDKYLEEKEKLKGKL